MAPLKNRIVARTLALLCMAGALAGLVAGCSKAEPKPNAPGYYEGPRTPNGKNAAGGGAAADGK